MNIICTKCPISRRHLSPPTENFFQLIEAATGRRSADVFHVVQIDPRSFDFADLLIFAYDRGWSYDQGREVYRVTSTTGDRHGELSFHYDGRAIDIGAAELSSPQKSYIENEFARVGVRLYDETIAKNKTAQTSGPCLHFDTAAGRKVRNDISWGCGRARELSLELEMGGQRAVLKATSQSGLEAKLTKIPRREIIAGGFLTALIPSVGGLPLLGSTASNSNPEPGDDCRRPRAFLQIVPLRLASLLETASKKRTPKWATITSATVKSPFHVTPRPGKRY